MFNDSAPPGKELKYVLVERERRFLLGGPPREPGIRTVFITDRYIAGTRTRLRRAVEGTDGAQRIVHKLTQKVPSPDRGPGLITTMYLNDDEYRALAVLPAAVLHKTRHSIPPFGVDYFDGPLKGLYLAEAEFTSDTEAAEFSPGPLVVAEVTHDHRFSGGYLASATREDIAVALAEYGLSLPDTTPEVS
jgi:CYTH domain-containing protein